MTRDDLKAVTFSVAIMAALSLIWYHAWVKPHDQYMYAIMDCMEEMNDHSKEAYNYCAQSVRATLNETR